MPFLVVRGIGDAGDGTQSTLRISRGLGSPGGVPVFTVFDVLAARSLAPMVVRVTFSAPVRRLSAAATDDALNPALWTTTGPTNATLEVVLPVPEDPASVDLFYAAVLPGGTWTVTAGGGIAGAAGQTLVAPFSASFQVGAAIAATQTAPVTPDERVLRKHLNSVLRGKGWNALIVALDNSDRKTWDVARAVRAQRYLSTASGTFLVQRVGERGLEVPRAVGLSDSALRQLAVTLANRRLTTRAVQDLLETFYGPATTRAGIASRTEPYELRDGDELYLLLGEVRHVTIAFSRQDAVRIARATATEVAAAVNRGLRTAGLQAYAEAVLDPTTGIRLVQVHADARGLSSSIRVVGGRAQVALGFPELLFPGAVGPFGVWNLTLSPTAGRVRFTLTGTTPFDLAQVVPGDYALVYGEEFPEHVRGSYPIVQVFKAFTPGLTQWFEVEAAFAVAGVVQAAATSLVFHRPDLLTIHDNARRAFSSSAPGRGVDLTLPATSPAVARGPGRASYRHGRDPVAVAAATRDATGLVTVTTAIGHGLDAGGQVFLDGMIFGTAPHVTVGSPSGNLGATFL